MVLFVCFSVRFHRWLKAIGVLTSKEGQLFLASSHQILLVRVLFGVHSRTGAGSACLRCSHGAVAGAG